MPKISKRLKDMQNQLEEVIKAHLDRESYTICLVEDGGLLAVNGDKGNVVMEISTEEVLELQPNAEVVSAKEFRKTYKHNFQDELRNHENLLTLYLSSRQKSSDTRNNKQTKEEEISLNGEYSPLDAALSA